MPRDPYGRSLLDRILGVPRFGEFQRQAEEERKRLPAFDFIGPPQSAPSNFKEFHQQSVKDVARATELRQEGRREHKGQLRESLFASLPYMMGMLVADSDQALQGNVRGAADSMSEIHAQHVRKKEEDTERAFRSDLLDKENRARQDERLAGQAFQERDREDSQAFNQNQFEERLAQDRSEATGRRADAALERLSRESLTDKEIKNRTELTRLEASLRSAENDRTANREQHMHNVDGLVSTILTGEDPAKIFHLVDLSKKNPFDPLVRAYAQKGEQDLLHSRAEAGVTQVDELNAAGNAFSMLHNPNQLTPMSPGLQEFAAALEGRAMSLTESINRKNLTAHLPTVPGFEPEELVGPIQFDRMADPGGRQLVVEQLNAAIDGPNGNAQLKNRLDELTAGRDVVGQPIVPDSDLLVLARDLGQGRSPLMQSGIQREIEAAIQRRKDREAFERAAKTRDEEMFMRRSLPPILQDSLYPNPNF